MKKALNYTLSMLFGVALGLSIVLTSNLAELADESFLLFFAAYLGYAVLAALIYFASTLLHEAGHLIFGLLTGYGFVSFRVGNLMLVRTSDGLRFRRFSLAGTGGQCLLSPPERSDGKKPVHLYNLGGVIMNMILAVVFFALFLRFGGTFFILVFLINAFMALRNGIPSSLGGVPNDGANGVSMLRDERSIDALWLQLRVNRAQMEGLRLRDMPDEWFTLEGDMENALFTSCYVFRENRALDMHDFETAEKLCDELLAKKIIELYRMYLMCDKLFLSALRGEPEEKFLDLNYFKAFLKQPVISAARTNYAVARLVTFDEAEAQRSLEVFEKIAKAYPAAGDIALERELIDEISRKEVQK
ncbi:MAG: M50 family metallopeptidase [Oscillospiraceae bacterium]|nr:M50 family metallopeptidase [Oscillospiraceae bacterium]